jgi:diguanylate cyclase (GGDEF)-like protein
MHNKGEILVVDDTYASLKLITELLLSEGYQVRPADNGGLALASTAAKAPDLILLDIQMAGMNGFEVIQNLKKQEKSRDIPIIFLSAVTEAEQRVMGLKLGAVDFITKPFQKDELLARVKIHLELRRLYSQLELQTLELKRANNRLIEEIAECEKSEAKVRELSLTDELTGLYNRRGLLVMADLAFKIADRMREKIHLIYIDVDDLKVINDTFGHAQGDQALIDVAEILKSCHRKSDVIARIGGDEFVVLTLHQADIDKFVLLARIQKTIDIHNTTPARLFHISLSIGFAQCMDGNRSTLDEYIKTADQEMYKHKLAKRQKIISLSVV